MKKLQIRSTQRKQMIDITAEAYRAMEDLLHKHRQGALLLFCQHTTAALTVNENADPSVVRDVLQHYGQMVPHRAGFTHSEGNSDSHIQSIMTGPSLLVPFADGRLVLGTWQGIYFCEFDGPRHRQVVCQLLPELL